MGDKCQRIPSRYWSQFFSMHLWGLRTACPPGVCKVPAYESFHATWLYRETLRKTWGSNVLVNIASCLAILHCTMSITYTAMNVSIEGCSSFCQLKCLGFPWPVLTRADAKLLKRLAPEYVLSVPVLKLHFRMGRWVRSCWHVLTVTLSMSWKKPHGMGLFFLSHFATMHLHKRNDVTRKPYKDWCDWHKLWVPGANIVMIYDEETYSLKSKV